MPLFTRLSPIAIILMICVSCTTGPLGPALDLALFADSGYHIDVQKNKDQYVNVEVTGLRDDTHESGAGFVVYGSDQTSNKLGHIEDGVYIAKKGGFKIRVPRLSTGKVAVRQSEVRQGVDFQVRFYEKDTFPVNPWDPSAWHAAVVSTLLPPEYYGRYNEVFGIIADMQKQFTSQLAPATFTSSRIKGPLGLAHQTIVINRYPTHHYPQSDVKVLRKTRHVASIGINRVIFSEGTLVEFGIIVSRPQGMAVQEFARFALNEMDVFMSGFAHVRKGK